MRNIKSILLISIMLIVAVPGIGICKKNINEKDIKEMSVVGNTYRTKLYSDNVPDFFCMGPNCDQKSLFIAEDIDIDFQILDLVESGGRVAVKYYKVMLDPDGKRLLAYIDKDRFQIMENSHLNGTSLKTEMNHEEKQRLISDNERNRLAEELREKRIAKDREIERRKRDEQAIKQKVVDIKKKHSDWNDLTIQHIARGNVHIGMTREQAVTAWGKPQTVNKTTTARLIHEQWCYDGSYLYFENGILTAIQN